MNKLYEELSVFEGMPATTVGPGDLEVGPRFSLGDFRRALFFVELTAEDRDAWIDDAEVHVILNEAKQLAAGDVNDIKTAEVVGGSNVIEAEIWTQNHANDDTVTINGVTFTRTGAGYDAATRPLQWVTPAELVLAINGQDMGITAHAAAAGHDVRITADDPGNMTLNIDVDIANLTGQLATLKACAAIEVYIAEIDYADDYQYLFVSVNNDFGLAGAVDAYCVAVKGAPNNAPCHNVWAARAL